MRILVTGGAGFIGSHVVDQYIAAGHQVSVVDNLSTGRRSNLNPRAVFYEVDIRSAELENVFKAEKPELVNHHAAHLDIFNSIENPLEDASVNILGSINLFTIALRHNVRNVIYISCGEAVIGEPVYLPCDENHPVKPLNPYGASKHAVEHYLHLLHANFGLEFVILRYPHVYGPRQNPAGVDGVVAIFAGKMLQNQPITIYGDGRQERDFVYVDDCVQANLLALNCPNPNSVYHLGSGHGISINDIFANLKKLTGYRGGAVHGPERVGETRRIYLNPDKARRELGWSLKTSLKTGLEHTVAFMKEHEPL